MAFRISGLYARQQPPIATPKSRPVGYGMIRTDVCTDSKIRRLEEGNLKRGIAKQNKLGTGDGVFSVGTNLLRRVFGLPKETGRYISTRNTCGISCARSYRTLRDGSFDGRFPRHFVPGYDQPVPPGQSHSPIEGPCIKLALMGNSPRLCSTIPSGTGPVRLDESIEIKVEA